jgi:tight adherence protein B
MLQNAKSQNAKSQNAKSQNAKSQNAKSRHSLRRNVLDRRSINVFLIILATGVFALALSSSLAIAISFSLFVTIFHFLARRRSETKHAREIQEATPEMIDHIISGIQSGLSLNDCIVGLGVRGPIVMRPYFLQFRDEMKSSGKFSEALDDVKEKLGQHSTDLVFEALIISKTLGGSELLTILRLLGNFVRDDLALRREIAVKQGWIKNSAHLSAAAPWILLLLLSTQPSTARAFSTFTGGLILLSGLVMTALAYIWMNHLSQMPDDNRLFSRSKESR